MRISVTKRILHILDHSIPLHSGYTFRSLALFREQRKLGWETFHLTSPKHEAPTGEEIVDGWRFFRTPFLNDGSSSIPGIRELKQMNATAQRLEQVAREIRPDVLHAHSPVLNAIPALRVGKRLGIPVVYEVRAFWEDAAVDHGTSNEGGLRYRATRALETYALKRADAVTTICEGLRREIVARGLPSDRVTVIPNAVDVEAFSSNAVDQDLKRELGLDGATVLGFIGSFYAYEGLDLLMQALPEIVRRVPDVKLLLVGGGPEEQRLRQMASDPQLAGRVIFTGRVPNDQVSRYYALIDVLVYPRHSMRLTELVTPLKPLEAMAQGCLLIASDVGGHRELIRDRENGILFRADSVEDLVSRLVELLSSRETWAGLRAAGRSFVENDRNWKRSVERYREVYASLESAGGQAR